MSEYDLYQMVNGWDDGGRIGFDYWQDTFAEFYQIESQLISKKTRQPIDAKLKQTSTLIFIGRYSFTR
jgi:hypothetical protein